MTGSMVNGESNEEDNQLFDRLEPPAPKPKTVDRPFWLILQILYTIIVVSPVLILWSIVKYYMFTGPKPVRGKVVLITGTGRGLGRGYALKFAELGCKVACADVDDTINQETVNLINEKYPGSATLYRCNVAFPQEIRALKKAVEQDLGPVFIVLHNAAVITGRKITDFDDLYINGMIAINLTSHFYFIREFLPDMIKRNEGHFVSVASVAGFAAIPNASAYVTTKHGIMGLLESLYLELCEIPNNKVRCSVICPAFVNTSAVYSRQWSMRVAELSIEETVKAAVDGILKNQRIIAIPGGLYALLLFSKLFPDRLMAAYRRILNVTITPPTAEFEKKFPLYNILMQSADKFHLSSIFSDDNEKKSSCETVPMSNCTRK